MLFDVVRRLAAILLTVSLVLGPSVSSVHASSMDAKMVSSAVSNTHSSGMCGDCSGSQNTAPMVACSPYCTSVAPAVLASSVFQFIQIAAHGYLPSRDMAGRHVPPDPYPPRPAVLS